MRFSNSQRAKRMKETLDSKPDLDSLSLLPHEQSRRLSMLKRLDLAGHVLSALGYHSI